MFARVAMWRPMPDDDRQWVIDAAKTVPGVLDAYHLVDEATGDALSFFEDGVHVDAVKSAIAARAKEIGWHDRPRPTSETETETIYKVIRRGLSCLRTW